MHPHSTGTEPLRPGPLCTLPVCLYVCPSYQAGERDTAFPRLCSCSREAPQSRVVRRWVPTRTCDCVKSGGSPAGLSPEPLGSASLPGRGSRDQTKLLDALLASQSGLGWETLPTILSRHVRTRADRRRRAPAGSPHPAVGLAVGRVDVDGALAVLHRPGVVAQLAVGRGSAETAGGQRRGLGAPAPRTAGGWAPALTSASSAGRPCGGCGEGAAPLTPGKTRLSKAEQRGQRRTARGRQGDLDLNPVTRLHCPGASGRGSSHPLTQPNTAGWVTRNGGPARGRRPSPRPTRRGYSLAVPGFTFPLCFEVQ